MAIYLTTGKPGSYKSASTIEKALKIQKEGRLVYFCNFRGLKAEKYNLNTIDHFNEWENLPDGAVLFVDEVQEFTRDVPTAAKTEDLPKWFTALEKHRHRGLDIYVNTQHPMFVHTHLRRLLEKHWHLQRVEGMPWANLRMWQQICNDPEDIKNASIKMGCTTSIYRPSKDVFNYYESTVLDTHRFKIPPKLIKYSAMALAGFAFSAYLFSGFASKYLNISDKSVTDSSVSAPVVKDENLGFSGIDERTQEQRQIDYQTELNRIKYNVNNPFDVDYTAVHYEVAQLPQFAGCVKFEGKYYGYTQQGTRLDISQADCQKVMNGERPFNPFL